MIISASTALWMFVFTLPICIWVAWNDMKFMKIPNKAVMALMALFVIIGFITLPLATFGWQLLHFVVILAFGFILNMIGAIGAGDAKFAAAMAPYIMLGDAPRFCYLLAAVIVAAVVTHRGFKRIPAFRAATADWMSWDTKSFPMGLALGPALAIYLALGAYWGA